MRLEITWTLASLLALVFIFVLTMRAVRVADPPATRGTAVTVVGHQWWWEVRYADGATTANEIHLATGVDVLVGIESADVIHSFWVPGLGRKPSASQACDTLQFISHEAAFGAFVRGLHYYGASAMCSWWASTWHRCSAAGPTSVRARTGCRAFLQSRRRP